jgi:hypothetical protein
MQVRKQKLDKRMMLLVELEPFGRAHLQLAVHLSPPKFQPERFGEHIRAETLRWSKVVKDSGAKVD